MRCIGACVLVVTALAGVQGAEARARGGSVFKGSSSRAALTPAAAGMAAPGTSRAARGLGVVVVPLPALASGRSQATIEDMRAAQDVKNERPATENMPTGSIAPTDAVSPPAVAAAPRPWCDDGYVAGSGKGFCVVTQTTGGSSGFRSVTN